MRSWILLQTSSRTQNVGSWLVAQWSGDVRSPPTEPTFKGGDPDDSGGTSSAVLGLEAAQGFLDLVAQIDRSIIDGRFAPFANPFQAGPSLKGIPSYSRKHFSVTATSDVCVDSLNWSTHIDNPILKK